METGDLPSHLRPLMRALTSVMRRRAPAIREHVERLRAENPDLDREALARKLIASTRRRVAATGAASGAAAIAAFRRLPSAWAGRAGSRALTRVLGRATARRVVAAAARTLPLAVGMAAGAGFDWVSVGLLGRAAMRYYGRAGADQAHPAGDV